MLVATVLGHLLFWLVGIVGVAIILLGFPGTFLILGAALIFAWGNGFSSFGWSFLALLLGIALLAELAEFGLGAVAASKYGSSRAGVIGAIIGAFVVGLMATPVAPPFGMILGAFIGAFLGSVLLELIGTGDWHRALRAGYGAFCGTVGGRVSKMVAAVVMLILLALQIY